MRIEPLHLPPEESRTVASAGGPCSSGSLDLENMVITNSSLSAISTSPNAFPVSSIDSTSRLLSNSKTIESQINFPVEIDESSNRTSNPHPRRNMIGATVLSAAVATTASLSPYILKPVNISSFKKNNSTSLKLSLPIKADATLTDNISVQPNSIDF